VSPNRCLKRQSRTGNSNEGAFKKVGVPWDERGAPVQRCPWINWDVLGIQMGQTEVYIPRPTFLICFFFFNLKHAKPTVAGVTLCVSPAVA
jgi:hypothetical protein